MSREVHFRFLEGEGGDSSALPNYLKDYDSVINAKANLGAYLNLL